MKRGEDHVRSPIINGQFLVFTNYSLFRSVIAMKRKVFCRSFTVKSMRMEEWNADPRKDSAFLLNFHISRPFA